MRKVWCAKGSAIRKGLVDKSLTYINSMNGKTRGRESPELVQDDEGTGTLHSYTFASKQCFIVCPCRIHVNVNSRFVLLETVLFELAKRGYQI